MPISAGDLTYLGGVALDKHLRNAPTDQIGVELPMLKKMMAKRKHFGGAKQNISGNIRTSQDSAFNWTYGTAAVSFNTRQTTKQFNFPWRRAVDSLMIGYDTLFGAGIKVTEGSGRPKMENSEKEQLFNLLEEQVSVLRDGFMNKLDIELYRSGASSTDAVAGVDSLISLTPAVGTIGGIDASTVTAWRNNVQTAIASTTAGALAEAMNEQWRACIRNGGVPDFILAGSDFIDAYARYAVTLVQNSDASAIKRIDAGVGSGAETGLFFKGVPIVWAPNFSALDALDAPAIPWEKRCYFINTKHLSLHDDGMEVITPTRPHNTLALYQMINLRLALVTDRRNAHSVLAIA
jgi:hypothetical protein